VADAFSGNIYGVKFDLQTFYLTCSDKTMITEKIKWMYPLPAATKTNLNPFYIINIISMFFSIFF
jgi:hypothetical protein